MIEYTLLVKGRPQAKVYAENVREAHNQVVDWFVKNDIVPEIYSQSRNAVIYRTDDGRYIYLCEVLE